MTTLTHAQLNGMDSQTSTTEREMEKLGFYPGESRAASTMFYKDVPGYELSLSVQVFVDGRPPKIVAYDERTMEPYDFKSVLKHNGHSKPALKAKAEVERLMKHFVLIGFVKGWHNMPLPGQNKKCRYGEYNQQERRH